jgi:hypothetical protein
MSPGGGRWHPPEGGRSHLGQIEEEGAESVFARHRKSMALIRVAISYYPNISSSQ